MSASCQAKTAPLPDPKLPVRQWLAAAGARVMSSPCGRAATHVAYDGRPLCDAHAEELRASLRSPDTVGNLIAGRGRTKEEIAALVRPLV
jgi:hypothetical protein